MVSQFIMESYYWLTVSSSITTDIAGLDSSLYQPRNARNMAQEKVPSEALVR